MRLQTKTTLIFLALSLLPLFLMGGVAYLTAEDAIKKSLGSSFQKIAHEASDKVDRNIYEIYRNIETWSKLDLMQEVITGDLDGNITSFLIGLNKEYGYFSSIVAFNRAGKAVASSNPELIGGDFSDQSLCTRAVNGQPFVEDVHLDEKRNVWVMTFAFPIKAKFSQDKIVGVLCSQWKASELVSLTQTHPAGQAAGAFQDSGPYLFLLRGDGLVLSAPESRVQYILKENLRQSGMRSVELASEGTEGYLTEKNLHLQDSLIGYSYSKGYRDFQGFHWTILVTQDAKIAFSLIRKLYLAVVGMGAIVALSVIVISLATSRKMAGPILHISKIAEQVSRGDFDGKAVYTAQDEIGTLATTFNRMIQDLKRQRAQLVDKNYVDSIIVNMLNSLIVINHEMIIKTVNNATLDLLEYAETEIVGESIKSILAGKPPFDESWLEKMILNGSIRNFETAYKSKSGKTIPVIFSCSIMQDDRGQLQGIICVAQDLTERKKAETALAEQAIRDSLTNLYNRRYFNTRMEQEIDRADREKHVLAILLCDIDHFKIVNDIHGHQVGDEVLRTMAKGMQKATRGTDLVFRWGGDEFVVVLSNSNREGVLTSAERIRKEVHSISQTAKLNMDLSIGVALYPEHGTNMDELIRLADRALYIAKKGGDKIHIGEEEYCLNENTIKVVFQPIMDVRSDQIIGYEALSRDAQGKLGILELFKRYQAIGQLDELKCLCFRAQIKAAEDKGLKRVFINADFAILDQIEFIPKPSGVEIILEISEAEALRDVETHLRMARKWRDGGYQFAIDDFGAGFVSLPFIATLVPDYIKMDRSTILQAVSSETFRKFSKDLVRALKNYAKEGIIAEGIETEKELKVVKEMGMYIVQGFLFGKPQELK